MTSNDLIARGSAIISPCGQYRYRLERQGPGDGQTTVIMVNPSTADATEDDATIRKLIGFGSRHNWGRIVVGNLFAFRATDVRELKGATDPRGPLNENYLTFMMAAADRIVVAWGPVGKQPKALRDSYKLIVAIAADFGKPLYSIGEPAKDGHPCHPLMLPYSRTLQPWTDPAACLKARSRAGGEHGSTSPEQNQ